MARNPGAVLANELVLLDLHGLACDSDLKHRAVLDGIARSISVLVVERCMACPPNEVSWVGIAEDRAAAGLRKRT
jgi:hypothetical protein